MSMRAALGTITLALLAPTLLWAGPMRPLATPSTRPAAKAPAYYVDAANGDDSADGSQAKPWKTLAGATKRLKPGDTLYLRGGVHYESLTLSLGGTLAAPITIRSAPGELAVIDGGAREFAVSPKTAWEPVPDGAPNEYRSTATYLTGAARQHVAVTGHFVDTMIPLHAYKFDADLRSKNEYWVAEKDTAGDGVYLGPGVWFDSATHKVHVRLSPTTLKNQPNYAGEVDPRKVPLVIGFDRSALRIEQAAHVRVQDLVLRGSAEHTLHVADSHHIDLDGLTIYGGSPAMFVRSTKNLRMVRSNVRGRAAPWSSRTSMKYRSDASYLFIASGALPRNEQWELAYNEFTDDHDGLVLDGIKTLRFHHNRVDNFNDDALYLTLVPRDSVPEDVHIYQNLITRSYTALAFGDRGAKQPNPVGSGIHLFRNVFDLREGVYFSIPSDPRGEQAYKASPGWMCRDHGSPTWEPMFFYNNTVITAAKPWRDYYAAAMIVKTQNTKRRLFNNIFLHVDGMPGSSFKGATDHDLQADANLAWSANAGGSLRGDLFRKFQGSPAFDMSKDAYPPGWTANDVVADPRFLAWSETGTLDLRLQAGSPAINTGIAVPATWPDPLRGFDKGKPDIGALPAGAPALEVGPRALASSTPLPPLR